MIDFQVGKSVAPAAKATPIAVSLIDKKPHFFETLNLRRETKTEAPKTTIKRGSKEQSLFTSIRQIYTRLTILSL